MQKRTSPPPATIICLPTSSASFIKSSLAPMAATNSITKTEPTPSPVLVIYSTPPTLYRDIECITESRLLESLFLLSDNARDSHVLQVLQALPHLQAGDNVVRNMRVKVYQDGHGPTSPQHDSTNHHRVAPRPPALPLSPWQQLSSQSQQYYRVETNICAVGRTSLRMEHRFFTVPPSQADRNFNARREDKDKEEEAKRWQLKEGEVPERLFAAAEGTLVFIKWHEDPKSGRRNLAPTQGPLQDNALAIPPTIRFLREQAPERRPQGSLRPDNAFRVLLHLRSSDKDELGHVTNSRYAPLVHDVLTFGLRSGYYANGAGPYKTNLPLPVCTSQDLLCFEPPSLDSIGGSKVAVPVGRAFYKDATVLELFIGYENELKVKPEGIFVWSWVEREKIDGHLDVIRFEICSENPEGQEKLVSLCRTIICPVPEVKQKASL
ncbi:hypothetical protein BGZ70_007246 [Mortierella alpina]|uniref:Uncharacterized protein n=1 Tax=Mortierella alpina TaxID=64518 RepID=A0A9P6J6D3_MORAP|nr:hypothetical protein BGZ70_007246 [Mortierella alpina]